MTYTEWIDLAYNEFKSFNKKMVLDMDLDYIEFEDKGVFAFMIYDNLVGKTVLEEWFLYLKPEHRNIKNFRSMIQKIEAFAKVNDCNEIKFSPNIGYETERVKKLYKLFGFKPSSFTKEI